MSTGGGQEWVMIGIEEKAARRQGVPTPLPVPKAEFEGLADKGLQIDTLKKWIAGFMQAAAGSWRHQNGALAARYDAFLAKADLAKKAEVALAKQDHKNAISSLKMILGIDPQDHASRLNLGSALAATGDLAGALKHFEAVAETFEGEADYHVARGHLYMGLQRRDDAIGQMVLALEARPDHQGALDGLKNLGVLVAVYDNPKDAASLTYVRKDSVAIYMQQVWDAEPRDGAYYLEQVAYHESERRHDVVLLAAERAIAAKVDGAALERVVMSKTAALRGLGRVDEALAVAVEAAKESPQSAAAQVELAKCHGALGHQEEAASALARALELDPGDLVALDMRFWPAERNDIGILQEAVPPLQQYCQQHEGCVGALRSLARLKLAVGSSDEALALLDKALKLTPADDELRAEYWSDLAKLAKFEEILTDAATLTDLAKRDWRLRWNEAEAYLGLKRNVEARAAFAAINHDESLLLDIRKRAKRAAEGIGA